MGGQLDEFGSALAAICSEVWTGSAAS